MDDEREKRSLDAWQHIRHFVYLLRSTGFYITHTCCIYVILYDRTAADANMYERKFALEIKF